MLRRIGALSLLAVTGLAVLPPLLAPVLGWRSDALPPPGRRVRVGEGARYLNLLDQGRGAPVVLVHGLPGSAYGWGDLPGALVRAGLRVIRYDRIGYGYSSRPAPGEALTFETGARDLLDLMDAVGLERAALVGWSYGGGIAQEAARLSPARVERLVLVGSVGPGLGVRKPGALERALLSAPVLRWSFGSGFPARLATVVLASEPFGSAAAIPEGWVERTTSLLGYREAFLTWRREREQMAPGRLRPEKVEVPTLVIQGAADRLVPLAVGEGLDRRLPHSRLSIVVQGSHMLPLTRADQLAGEILGFVGRRGSSR